MAPEASDQPIDKVDNEKMLSSRQAHNRQRRWRMSEKGKQKIQEKKGRSARPLLCNSDDDGSFARWRPVADYCVCPDINRMISVEVVNAVGTATNQKRFFFFESLYDEFCARGEEDVKVLKSFIKALSFRRCRSADLLSSLLHKIFRNPLLDEEDWEDLASIVADMSSKPLVDELVLRSAMGSRAHRPCFYSHLMRFAAEQLAAPCFGLAMAVVEAMDATGATWTEATMYHLLGAFCRLKDDMPYATILHLVTAWRDARVVEDFGGEPDDIFPVAIMSRILSLCERALGSDVLVAAAIINMIGDPSVCDRAIALVGPTYECEPHPVEEDWKFFIIDPLTIDLTIIDAPSPGTTYCFTFSSVRTLCESAELHHESHSVFANKIAPIRRLLELYPKQAAVIPIDIEVMLRIGSARECHPTPSTVFYNRCPRCLSVTAPPGVVGECDCVLPRVLPRSNGFAQLSYFAKCGGVHYEYHRCQSIVYVTTHASVINDIAPIAQRFAAIRVESIVSA